MQHHIIKSLLFSASLSKVHRTFFTLALGAMLLTAIGCEKENNNEPASTTDTVPQQPEDELFSLTGTAWMMVQDEWWSSTLHFIDTSIWRFQTDSTGTFSEHFISNGNDPLGVEIYPMTYTFDAVTLEGILYGYEHPIEFTYHPDDTIITYDGTRGTYTYYPLTE